MSFLKLKKAKAGFKDHFQLASLYTKRSLACSTNSNFKFDGYFKDTDLQTTFIYRTKKVRTDFETNKKKKPYKFLVYYVLQLMVVVLVT